MPSMKTVKRGDTIIEVTLAFAIFSLVAILTIAMMNLGLSASERSLELVTARNELNAQAEALRFVHSSYISEMTLPTCDSPDLKPGEKCQQYAEIWNDITSNAIDSSSMTINYPLSNCNEVYDNDNQLLRANNAFVINTRQLISSESNQNNIGYLSSDAILWSTKTNNIFQKAPLNARIIYSPHTGADGEGDNNSTGQLSSISLNEYLRVAKVEGIWTIPVAGPDIIGKGYPQYYDFYIETCWYGSGNPAPTSLDTVVRLYNPEGAK